MDERIDETSRNPESTSADTPAGLIRHRWIVGGCIALAISMIGFSSIDFAPMVKRKATIDKSFHITYAPKLAELSPRLTYVRTLKLSEGLIPVMESTWDRELVGFVDKDGKIAIKPQFAEVSQFSDGLASARTSGFDKNDKYGFIDKSGRFVITPQFSSVGEFKNGVCAVVANKKGALIDKTGHVIIKSKEEDKPARYGNLYTIKATDEHWGLVDKTGRWVVQPEYSSIGVLCEQPALKYITSVSYSAWADADISESQDSPYLLANKNGHSYILDMTGRVLVPGLTDEITSFANGVAQSRSPHAEISFVDSSGKTILKTAGTEATPYDSLIAVKNKNAWKLIDTKGNAVPAAAKIDAPLPGNNWTWFNEGLAPALVNGKCGYLDRSGKFVIAPKFKWVTGFSDGYASVYDGADWTYIDHNGKNATPMGFGRAATFTNGVADVVVEGTFYKLNEAMSISSLNDRIEAEVSSMRDTESTESGTFIRE